MVRSSENFDFPMWRYLMSLYFKFGIGSHVCPKVGIETMGVYDVNEPLRQSELRLDVTNVI